MSTPDIVRLLSSCLQGRVHGHQLKAVCALVSGLCVAAHCHLSRIAARIPGKATVPSRKRRLQRFLSNPRIHVDDLLSPVAAFALGRLAGGRLVLILDETCLQNHLRVMVVALAYKKRAFPLSLCCYPLNQSPREQKVHQVLQAAAQCLDRLPGNVSIVLLSDRGLCWPSIIAFCRERRWDYVLRTQRGFVLTTDDGTRCHLSDLVCAEGARTFTGGTVLNAHHHVVAVWHAGQAEPWFLLSSLPASHRVIALYEKRMWIEETFRDAKSCGFFWNHSRVHRPEHAQRLLLLIALAILLALFCGAQALQKDKPSPNAHRTFSLFRIGWDLLLQPLLKAPT